MSQALQQALQALRADAATDIAERDRVNALNAPLEAELAAVIEQHEALRVRMEELSAQIDANRGGQAWLDLKRRIGRAANTIMDIRRQLGV
ncbi:MAG: hypothetical protein KA265_15770 [Piscinibacter sp.]|nr:hypothetical protein [Piscinibacter sp.]